MRTQTSRGDGWGSLRGSVGKLMAGMFVLLVQGCSAPPEIMGFAANTPDYYSEDKMFYTPVLDDAQRYDIATMQLLHVYGVKEMGRTAINKRDPLAVILEGVRVPEEAHQSKRDIAVVLDINTSVQNGLQSMVVFYQRDVPPGQMLNFSNLLVFAQRNWDGQTPPYFRVRVLDCKAERNTRTEKMLNSASKLMGEVTGLIPHPIIPVVTRAIEAAGQILANQRNRVIMDFQVQLYSSAHASAAGNASLGVLYAGRIMVVGRQRGHDATSWGRDMFLNRQTGQIVDAKGGNYPMPYVSIILMKSDVQVPKLVMDRSEALIKLLSSAESKTDLDSLDAAAKALASSISAYSAERRLDQNGSAVDLQNIITLLKIQGTDGNPRLSASEQTHMLDVINRAVGKQFPSVTLLNAWWEKSGSQGTFGRNSDDKADTAWYWVVPGEPKPWKPAATNPPTPPAVPVEP